MRDEQPPTTMHNNKPTATTREDISEVKYVVNNNTLRNTKQASHHIASKDISAPNTKKERTTRIRTAVSTTVTTFNLFRYRNYVEESPILSFCLLRGVCAVARHSPEPQPVFRRSCYLRWFTRYIYRPADSFLPN
jgi:hypothetical protein